MGRTEVAGTVDMVTCGATLAGAGGVSTLAVADGHVRNAGGGIRLNGARGRSEAGVPGSGSAVGAGMETEAGVATPGGVAGGRDGWPKL